MPPTTCAVAVFFAIRVVVLVAIADEVLSEERFYTDADIRWFDPGLGSPDWTHSGERRLACLIHERDGGALYLMFNAGADAAAFRVPLAADGAQWHLAVDTDGESPRDVFARGEEPLFDSARPCPVAARSARILLRRTGSPGDDRRCR